MSEGTVDCAALAARYDEWRARVRRMHPNFEDAYLGNADAAPAWTAADRPLAESTVMLVSSAGVHGRHDGPFDLKDGRGDESIRRIDGAAGASELVASHAHYDTDAANADINVVFPIDALRALRSAGTVRELSPVHFGFMGFIPDPGTLGRLADTLVAAVVEASPDVVVLSPG